jgi:undecaprenyl-diphosphatase
MSILQAIILGLVQGLTEFIPVSSSGHLILAHSLLGAEVTSGLAFDVALHIGTLTALLIYFHKDIWQLARSIFVKSEQTKLAYMLIAATIPAVIVGILLEQAAESAFRSVRLVAINFIVVSLIMLLAEWWYKNRMPNKTELNKVRPAQALAIGVLQAAALVPGVSRSGSTIVTGLFVGLDRIAATRFAFLLGIPITAGAIAKVLSEQSTIQTISSEKQIFAVGIITAFISGLAAIIFMLRYLAKHSLNIFAYYRLAVGTLVLALLFIR